MSEDHFIFLYGCVAVCSALVAFVACFYFLLSCF